MPLNKKYKRVLHGIDCTIRQQVVCYFVERGVVPGDVPGETFFDVLHDAGLCQADVVLCLLRLNSRSTLRLAEKLVGRRITHCPPCLALLRSPSPLRRRASVIMVTRIDEPVARDKRGRRRLLGCPMYARLARVHVGMSLEQVKSRGITARDLRLAIKRGYLKMEKRA